MLQNSKMSLLVKTRFEIRHFWFHERAISATNFSGKNMIGPPNLQEVLADLDLRCRLINSPCILSFTPAGLSAATAPNTCLKS